MSKNIQTVRGIYEAFGRGDISAILEVMRDDVDWEFVPKTAPTPWLVSGRGRDHVAKFFAGFADMEFHKFDVVSVMGDGDYVTVLVSVELTYKKTGKKVVEPMEAHVWKLDANGRVAAMSHFIDTHKHLLAAT